MNKLITYLKNGKGRGLKAMLVFSILATIITFGISYPQLDKLRPAYAKLYGIPEALVSPTFIISAFVSIWILYGLVVGVSVLFTKIFRLKLTKGLVSRATFVSLASLFVLSILFTLIAYLLALFGQNAVRFYSIVIMILTPILLVMLIAFGLAEQKEGKKKK